MTYVCWGVGGLLVSSLPLSCLFFVFFRFPFPTVVCL